MNESGEYIETLFGKLDKIDGERMLLSEKSKALWAEAKAKGLDTSILKSVRKLRELPDSERAERDLLLDTYRKKIGMKADSAPLFDAVGLVTVDTAVREEVIKAFTGMVPDNGQIIVDMDAKAVRLYRDAKGEVQAEDFDWPIGGSTDEPDVKPGLPTRPDRPEPESPSPPAELPEELQALDAGGAFALGQSDHADGKQIKDNPFPGHDPRRASWDRGWRAADGGDGMGPSGDEE
ncbi:MAG: GapR family DNA-binding domain-containing protein [Pseudomonadota bacterium]